MRARAPSLEHVSRCTGAKACSRTRLCRICMSSPPRSVVSTGTAPKKRGPNSAAVSTFVDAWSKPLAINRRRKGGIGLPALVMVRKWRAGAAIPHAGLAPLAFCGAVGPAIRSHWQRPTTFAPQSKGLHCQVAGGVASPSNGQFVAVAVYQEDGCAKDRNVEEGVLPRLDALVAAVKNAADKAREALHVRPRSAAERREGNGAGAWRLASSLP